MKTWQYEFATVILILFIVNLLTKTLFSIEILAALAVLLSFGHTQISSRLAEKESLKNNPDIHCYKKLYYYFIGKEMLWLIYFFANKSYSALVGVFIFLIYPVWRFWYLNFKNKK